MLQNTFFEEDELISFGAFRFTKHVSYMTRYINWRTKTVFKTVTRNSARTCRRMSSVCRYCSVVIATSKRHKFQTLSSAPRLSTSMTVGDMLSADGNYEKRINYNFGWYCEWKLCWFYNYLYLLIINIIQFILVNKLSNFPSERCTGWELAWGANWKKLSHDYGLNLICKNLGHCSPSSNM